MNVFEFLSPYLFYIIGFLILVVNLLLIFKTGSNIYVIIFLNIFISIILHIIGLGEYDLLTVILDGIINLIGDLLSMLFSKLADLLNPFTSCS